MATVGEAEDTKGRTSREDEAQREEMAFVRAADRAVKEEEAVDDSIVVVGRKKKRKRVGAAVPTAGGEVAEFDFSAVSNILDEEVPVKKEEGRSQMRVKKNRDNNGMFAFPQICFSFVSSF